MSPLLVMQLMIGTVVLVKSFQMMNGNFKARGLFFWILLVFMPYVGWAILAAIALYQLFIDFKDLDENPYE